MRKRTDDEGMVRIELRLQSDEAALFFSALREMKRQLTDDSGDDVSEEARPTLADAAVAMAEQQLAAEAIPSSKTSARPAAEPALRLPGLHLLGVPRSPPHPALDARRRDLARQHRHPLLAPPRGAA